MTVLTKQIVDFWEREDQQTDHAIVSDMWMRAAALGFTKEWREIPCEKYSRLVEMIEDSDGSWVIWTNFIKEAERVQSHLAAAGIKCGAVLGSVSMQHREEILKQFEEGNCKAILVNEQTGAFGLNELRDADYVAYFSNNYNYELRIQSEDRTYRAGRVKPAIYYDFVTEGSIEPHLLDVLLKKEDVSETFIREMARQNFIREVRG